jgi:localization factor PodJL
MRDRLASLSDEARSIRSQVPREFEPDVERIQQQMHRLGERLSELSTGVLYHGGEAYEAPSQDRAEPACEAVSDEVILLGGPARSDDPWDADSANALTRFYEAGDAGLGCQAEERPSASSGAGGCAETVRAVVTVEPAWLDRRFAEIAERIEQALAEINPQSSLLTIGRRFDRLEMRMASALRGVAMRADLKELRIAEAQIEDIGSQLDKLRRQLGRLDVIDAHLRTLTSQLSDERLVKLLGPGENGGHDRGRLDAIDSQLAAIASQLSQDRLADLINKNVSLGADLESLAASAAQKAAAHVAGQGLLEAHARDIGEVRGLIENLINERRNSDENNASMLETMQQAIVRLLDRIDALELGRQAGQAAAAPAAASAPAAETPPSLEPEAEDLQPAPMEPDAKYEPPQAPATSEARPEASFLPPAPPSRFETAPFDLDEAFDLDASFADDHAAEAHQPQEAEPPPRRVNVLRHDFIADAHRAKLKAASRIDSLRDLGQAPMIEDEAQEENAASIPPRTRTRGSFFKSPRVLMSILVLLAMIPATLFFLPRTPVDADTGAAAADTVLPAADHGASGRGAAARGQAPSPEAPVAPEGNGTDTPSDGMPSKQSQQTAPDAPRDAGQYQDVGVPGGAAPYGRIDTGALPDGKITEPDAEPASGRVVTRQRDGRTSELVAGPGIAATPAALMQEQVLRMNGVDTSGAGDQAIAGKPLGLPPAMVGPFSLRLAAAQGNPSAQYEVASRLAEGKGANQNLKEAAAWFLRSATSGLPMAQFRLGTLYERGVGVKTDLARAKVWYSRAAEQGNVKAMHNLAVLVAGRDREPDYPTAVRWFTEAAERGLADSQYNLAVLYGNGLGVAKDEKEAYKWLLLAARSGDVEATSRRDALKARLSKGDRAAVDAVVAAWRAKPIDPAANDWALFGQAWQRRPQGPTNG